MVKESYLIKIKEITEEFFKKMGFKVKIQINSSKKETPSILIETEEPQILIGERGKTLIEIQHLLRKILQKQIKEISYIDLDINKYKEKKIEYLKELAQSTADEVALLKKEKILPPMPAYERRIIHLELANREDVVTESVGQKEKRRVVIKPHF